MPIGFTNAEIPSLPMNLPLLKNYSIVGAFTGAWAERFPDERVRAADMIMAWVAEGKLHPRIDRVLPLEAHRRRDDRHCGSQRARTRRPASAVTNDDQLLTDVGRDLAALCPAISLAALANNEEVVSDESVRWIK